MLLRSRTVLILLALLFVNCGSATPLLSGVFTSLGNDDLNLSMPVDVAVWVRRHPVLLPLLSFPSSLCLLLVQQTEERAKSLCLMIFA